MVSILTTQLKSHRVEVMDALVTPHSSRLTPLYFFSGNMHLSLSQPAGPSARLNPES